MEQQVGRMKGSRRDFIRRALFGGMITGLISRAAFTSAEIESRSVDRLLRYALSLNGVHAAIVGLDSLNHLNEDAAVATGFRAMKTAERFEFHRNVSTALAGVVAPWEERGYVDGRDVS